MKVILLTNNKKVAKELAGNNKLEFLEEASYLEVLLKARDMVHSNYHLLTHPLSGSIKPNETPFKSVALSLEPKEFNMQSLEIIEASIETTKKLLNDTKPRNWPEKVLDDFKLIDYNLIKSGLESINQFN